VQTRPRDIPYGTAGLRLVWRKRRWRCTETMCERGSFTEAIPAVPARARLTVRLRAELAHAVAEQHRCVAETAAHYQVGWATVHDAFIAHVSEPLAAPAPAVRVLGIDETRRGKPIWTQDPDTHRWQLACDRWHTGFVDAAGTGGLLAQVQGRSAAVVTAWLRAQPRCGAAASPTSRSTCPPPTPRRCATGYLMRCWSRTAFMPRSWLCRGCWCCCWSGR